jgi:hypothetical protein
LRLKNSSLSAAARSVTGIFLLRKSSCIERPPEVRKNHPDRSGANRSARSSSREPGGPNQASIDPGKDAGAEVRTLALG